MFLCFIVTFLNGPKRTEVENAQKIAYKAFHHHKLSLSFSADFGITIIWHTVIFTLSKNKILALTPLTKFKEGDSKIQRCSKKKL